MVKITVNDIADVLNMRPSSVRQALWRRGIKVKQYDLEAVLRFIAERLDR